MQKPPITASRNRCCPINSLCRVECTEAIVATAPALIFGKSMVPLGTAARLGARAASLRPLGTPSSFHHLGRRRMASVTVYGPKAMDNARELFPTLGYAIGSFDACGGADVTIVLTERSQFRGLEPDDLDRRSSLYGTSDGFLPGFVDMLGTMVANNNKGVLLRTDPPRRRVHPLGLRNCNSLVNALDAGLFSPLGKLLSEDERGTPEPIPTDAFVSEKSVSHIAAR